jgi:hypothetical protein
MMGAMSRMGTISIPLAEMRDVSFGGGGLGGMMDDEEDEDDMNDMPCLNKVCVSFVIAVAVLCSLFHDSCCAVCQVDSGQQGHGD